MRFTIRLEWLKKISIYLEDARKIAFNLGIFLGIIVVTVLGWREYYKNTYILEEFNVPTKFEDNGYSGIVVATQILDKVNDMKNLVASMKEDKANLNSSAQIPDMDIDVVGMGISIQSTIEYLKALLGNPSKHLSGEITEQDSTLTLRLRITGENTAMFSTSLRNKKLNAALDTLYEQAGVEIIRHSEPYLLAGYFYSLRRYDESLLMLKLVTEISPKDDDAWAYALWGGILSLNNYRDSLAAIDKFKKALALEPRMPIVYANWALLHSNGKNYEKAVEFNQKAIDIEPNYVEGFLGKALAYRRLKKYEEAEKIFKELENRQLLNAKAYNAWGNLLVDEKKHEEALDKYKYAIFLEPKRTLTYNQLALCYYHLKKYQEGITYIQKGIEITPQNGILYSTLAELHEGLGDVERFYANVEKALSYNWTPNTLKNEPYNKYTQEPRFLSLIEKYPKTKKLLEKEKTVVK